MFALACAAPVLAMSKADEKIVLMAVVHKYELNEDEARLLFAIRQHENGKTGLEFGIGQDEGPGHPARRHKSPKNSLRVQAEWAAGTIKNRFDGDLKAFARTWCPKGPSAWYKSVNKILMTTYAQVPE